MFCFESAIKLYYYSHIIYHYDKVRHSLATEFACIEKLMPSVHTVWLLLKCRFLQRELDL